MRGVLAKYKVADVHDLTLENWKDAMEILKKKPDRPVANVPDKPEDGLLWNESTRLHWKDQRSREGLGDRKVEHHF